MNIHFGLLQFLGFAAYIVIFGFFWRYLSLKWADKPIGKAMGFIY